MKTKLLNKIKRGVCNHTPEIFILLGTVELIGTTVLVAKETPKAMKAFEEKKEELSTDKIPYVEVIKLGGKIYWKPIALGLLGVGSIIGGTTFRYKKYSALIASAGATSAMLNEAKILYNEAVEAKEKYKKVVEDTIDKKSADVIEEKYNKIKTESFPEFNDSEVMCIEQGDILFCDELSGRYFMSTVDKIEHAVNQFNKETLNGYYGECVNRFYELLGLQHILIGDSIGYNPDRLLEVDMTEAVMSTDGKPCILLSYLSAPKYDYDKN